MHIFTLATGLCRMRDRTESVHGQMGLAAEGGGFNKHTDYFKQKQFQHNRDRK